MGEHCEHGPADHVYDHSEPWHAGCTKCPCTDWSHPMTDPTPAAHGHGGPPRDGATPCVPIGDHACLIPLSGGIGYGFWHDADGRTYRHGGTVLVRGADPEGVWDQSGTLDGGDLTLSPSLLCSCGFHGWVRDGKWVPA